MIVLTSLRDAVVPCHTVVSVRSMPRGGSAPSVLHANGNGPLGIALTHDRLERLGRVEIRAKNEFFKAERTQPGAAVQIDGSAGVRFPQT